MRRGPRSTPPNGGAGHPQESKESKRTAFALACKYLTACERCSAQVRDYLKRKGFEEDEIARALESLRDRRLLDDMRFARLYVESRSRRSPRSRAFLVRELLLKGVDEETARRAVVDFLKEVPEEELARRLLARLPTDGPEARRRAARRLISRGFRPSAELGSPRGEKDHSEDPAEDPSEDPEPLDITDPTGGPDATDIPDARAPAP